MQYIEHFDWDAHQFFIIMEYVPLGDLGKFVQEHGTIREPYVKIMTDQLLDALGYLHKNKITHRDVKPDNILINSTTPFVVKLTDFGLSKMVDTEQTWLKTFCGTLLYCAPEVYSEYSTYDDNGRRTQRTHRPVDRERYDHAIDIWSLGGVLFYALTGSPPFPVKNGVTYTELLDHIIKVPVNTSPLSQVGLSPNGIHFLTRMIHVRPETRASISELQAHPWLASGSVSDDKDLGERASQLSLEDTQSRQFAIAGASALREPEADFSVDSESEKENYTFGQQANRLFGEVNNSAIGSSGAIPEDLLNLPVSRTSLGESDILETEILDSFEESENLSTPRQNLPNIRDPLQVDSRSVVLGAGSQSLGGDSLILGNLNVNSGPSLQPGSNDLNTSKRKTAYDTSDEYESGGAQVKPSFKRLKSQEMSRGDIDDSDTEEDETHLLASMPQVASNKSGRQIDFPVPKTTYWDSSNKDTWHLNYPEMTHLQYNAFKLATEKRKEEFEPGKTRLWDLAMKNFPPTPTQHPPGKLGRAFALRPALPKHDNRTVIEAHDRDMSPTASAIEDESDSIPSTLPLDNPTQTPSQLAETLKTVAAFYSTHDSSVPGISIQLHDPLISWGRDRTNTFIYEPSHESKVPKNAFRILLWRDGYSASLSEFRPWEPSRSTASRTMRASPEPDSYAFYISTKATSGIRINNHPLQANEPKNVTAACKYWVKLYHGDTITFWAHENVRTQGKLTFNCFWGGSSGVRPENEPPIRVPDPQARKLDRLWPKATNTLRYDKIKAEAMIEQDVRMQRMDEEIERCRAFEEKRAEAVRVLASRASRRASPASAPPISRRAVSQFRHNTPSSYLSSG